MTSIIFDIDGTLADSFDYVSAFLGREAGIKTLSQSQKNELRGLSMLDMAKTLGFKWWQMPKLYFTGRHRMNEAIKEVRAFEGMPELIKDLHKMGFPLYVLSTNSIENIHKFLDHQKLRSYFKSIYGGVGLIGKAPALRKLLKEQSLDKSQVVYVGDELRDVNAAQKVGVQIIAVKWGFARDAELKAKNPTALVDTPAELATALAKIS